MNSDCEVENTCSVVAYVYICVYPKHSISPTHISMYRMHILLEHLFPIPCLLNQFHTYSQKPCFSEQAAGSQQPASRSTDIVLLLLFAVVAAFVFFALASGIASARPSDIATAIATATLLLLATSTATATADSTASASASATDTAIATAFATDAAAADAGFWLLWSYCYCICCWLLAAG